MRGARGGEEVVRPRSFLLKTVKRKLEQTSRNEESKEREEKRINKKTGVKGAGETRMFCNP